ncbi:hypothetical protein COO60DRAFT_1481361 [Scenedesmus sp. NREL 46B-D3]|nr:hypothetical protein COO60DRAFT_1481361 [Scenedesmus sp. NREL 46B-D3]
MQRYVFTVASLIVLLAAHSCFGRQFAKKPPPLGYSQQQQQQQQHQHQHQHQHQQPQQQQQQRQQATIRQSNSTKPSNKPSPSVTAVTVAASKGPGQQELAQLYECVLCSKPAVGVARAAAASPSAQQQAVTALQTAGVQVNGRFGIQASVRLTPSQAASRAVQDNCCYVTPSTPTTG